MSTIDVLILVAYLVVMMAIGFFVGKKNETQETIFWLAALCLGCLWHFPSPQP